MARKLGVEGEEAKTLRLFALLFWLSLGSAVMKSAQNEIFLARYGRETIPWAFAASAVVLAAVATWMVAETGRGGTVRVVAAGAAMPWLLSHVGAPGSCW